MATPEEIASAQKILEDVAGSAKSFDDLLSTFGEGAKKLYETHTSGLKSALTSERDARKAEQVQLKDLIKKADKGSEVEIELNKQLEKSKKLERQAAFQESAHTAGVRNLDLAFLAADSKALVDDKGACDFVKLKASFPELFIAVGNANAGAGGNGGAVSTGKNAAMNAMIRRASGREE